MADTPLTRQQIYDRIRETSKDDFILEEMKRLGFWGKQEGEPSLPELLIKQETELRKELDKLLQEKIKFQNKEAVLKEMRFKRMEEAKEKRAAHKKKIEQQRVEKAEAWQKKKNTEINYLGEGVSIGLNNMENNHAALQKNNLPVFENETELATAMGLDIKELQFLAFQRKVSGVSHYRKFKLPKKSGGTRMISAPMPRLKKTQYWILENILNKVALHHAAHGFVADRSIVTNAQPHTGKDLVLNIDVKDFFPSIHYKRVKGMLHRLGYTEKISTILALICTEATTDEIEIDNKTYFVQKGNRVLPQGAPTSPAITNILCYVLDIRLQGLAASLACTYTRYADDITFSGNNEVNPEQLVWRIRKILQDEGFTMHPDKIRIMRKGTRQEVTGVVVNRQVNVSRQKLRQFRSLLHHLQTKPDTVLRWGKGHITDSIIGYANFVQMVNSARGVPLQKMITRLLGSGILKLYAQAAEPAEKPPVTENNLPDKDSNETPWWKIV